MPIPQIDTAINSFGSIPATIINNNTTALPYANMGDQDIHICAGQVLGHVQHTQTVTPTNIYINLTKPQSSLDIPHPPDLDDTTIPRTLPNDDTATNIAEADISPAFGPEFTQ